MATCIPGLLVSAETETAIYNISNVNLITQYRSWYDSTKHLALGIFSVALIKAPFTLRSIFGTARIKLVPVPLFWFLDYLYFERCLHYARFLVPYHFFGSWTT
jgi:hypothetical protein